jgi:hypothetical protein
VVVGLHSASEDELCGLGTLDGAVHHSAFGDGGGLIGFEQLASKLFYIGSIFSVVGPGSPSIGYGLVECTEYGLNYVSDGLMRLIQRGKLLVRQLQMI